MPTSLAPGCPLLPGPPQKMTIYYVSAIYILADDKGQHLIFFPIMWNNLRLRYECHYYGNYLVIKTASIIYHHLMCLD